MHTVLLTIATRELGDIDTFIAAKAPELTSRERRELVRHYFSGFREAGIRRSGNRYDAAKHIARYQLMCVKRPIADLIAEIEAFAPTHKVGRSALYSSQREARRFLETLRLAPPEFQKAFFEEEFGETFDSLLSECFASSNYIPPTDAGSACWARTSDPLINSQLLYQLS